MYFAEHQCLFFHIGKTAGTSIEQWLHPVPMDQVKLDRERLYGFDSGHCVYLQHATPALLRELLGEDLFELCYRFTVVRNPFARMLSVYYFHLQDHQRDFGSFEQYLRALPAHFREPTIENGRLHLPQTHYTQIDGQPCCHAVIRFEDLPGSLKPVAERLGITRPLPFVNTYRNPARGYRPVSSFYTPETTRLLLDVFAEDFETFGYSTDPETANES